MNTFSKPRLVSIWLLAVASFALLSPKWMFAPAAWIAAGFLLAATEQCKVWKSYLITASALFVSTMSHSTVATDYKLLTIY